MNYDRAGREAGETRVLADGRSYSTSTTFDAAGNVTQRGSTGIVTADDGTVIRVSTSYGKTDYLRDHRNLRLSRTGAAGDETYLYSPGGELVTRIGPLQLVACGGPHSLKAVVTERPMYPRRSGRTDHHRGG